MIGNQFQHSAIVGEIGRGEMRVACEADSTRLGHHVALTFLPDLHICTLFDVGIDADPLFIVMKLLGQ